MNKPVTIPAADREVLPGDNNPPVDPFGAIVAHMEDLLSTARDFADGEAVSSEGQAETVSRLIDDLRKADKAAEEIRKAEVKPLDEARDEIQARYNVYIAPLKNKSPGKVHLAIDELKKSLAPWLAAIEAENERKAAEARAEARRIADEAAAAMRAAQASSDLSAREDAEALVSDAAAASRAASQAENAKAHAGGGERNMGLRDSWVITGFATADEKGVPIDGPSVLLKHYWKVNPDALIATAFQLAQAEVRSGKRSIPGVIISNERRL